MILRELKNKLKSKEFKILFFSSLLIYLLLYLIIKNEFFYNAIQYNLKYINYYIDKYLSGNISDIIFNNSIYMYIESDVQNIFSSLYLYVISFNNNIFLLFTIAISIIIFHLISSKFHCDIFKKFSIPKITRIGVKKYIRNEIITNSVYSGLLLLLPRLCYLLILSLFFPNGVSSTHFIESVSFMSEKFLYFGYNCSPFLMIILDLIMVFIYGMILSLISMLIVSCIKNRSLSYLMYIFLLIVLCFVPWYFYEAPLFCYSSIYHYFGFFYEEATQFNVLEPVIIIFIAYLIVRLITRIILNKKVVDNI